jgi:hypothetical protein
LVIAIVGGLLMIAMGATRYLRDASMWLDEASIAYNLLFQTPAELFGPFLTGHRFPRLYLAAINGVRELFGYETLALRLLPIAAFVAGVVLYQRLLLQRWRSEPVLLALGVVLTLIPGTWFAYGAMLKQYSMDVLLALIPFLLADDFFEQTLRRGERRWRLLALVAPCLLSFTYVIPLLGRVIGWWLAGLRERGARIAPLAVGLFAAALVVGLAGMWWIDLRHTQADGGVGRFWRKCVLEGDPLRDLAIVNAYLSGWYESAPVFGGKVAVIGPLAILLKAALIAGALGTAAALVRPALVAGGAVAEENGWGSRSLGCLVTLGGLLAAGIVVGYPLCPGRLTLFSFFSLQIVTLEGLGLLVRAASPRRHLAAAVRVLIALCVVAALPAAGATVRVLLFRDAPENVRPLAPLLEARPELPIVVAACSSRQVETLPEVVDWQRVHYFDFELRAGGSGLPDAREFWVISAGSHFYCPWFVRGLRRDAESVELVSGPQHTAQLMRVRMPE